MYWILRAGLCCLAMMRVGRSLLMPTKKFLITNKTGGSYSEKNSLVFLNSNKFFKDKKVISVSPAGFNGFYVMGVCTYMKENYDTNEFVFSGASAGAWNALYMTLRTDPVFLKKLLVQNERYRHKNIFQIEEEMKETILKYYTARDFDLDRLFIGVTTFGQTNIYTDFESLEDAIDCCIASSHIPIVTGEMFHRYQNKCSFDGGFSESPYVNADQVALHLSPKMWNQNRNTGFHLLFQRGDFENLFQCGYRDTVLYGRATLDAALAI